MAYAITKTELMDIRVVIGRSLAYGLVGALLIISFFGLNAFHLSMISAMIANALLGLFWAFTAHRVREFIQTPLEEKWITGWYASDKLLNSIATRLVPVMEREAAFAIVAEELKKTIKIKNIDVVIGQPDPLVEEIKQTGKGVTIPLKSAAGVEGLLRLSEKVSEDPYDEKDLRLFRTLQVQILAILDRIRPYEQIKKDFGDSQQKLYEAKIELERSQRLASLGTLTAGVTHEIRNPLSAIRSENDRLPDKLRDLAFLREHHDFILRQVKRIDNIVNRMLGLAKVGETDKQLDLNAVIELTLQAIALNPDIQLNKELKELPAVMGNADELQEIFANLIQNAAQAMPKGGTLSLKTFTENDQVVAEVADTGAGIPAEIQGKIFDPFFSTRHEGAGLGLSIVFHIVQSHKGTIQFESQVGAGTTFKLQFPAVVASVFTPK